LHEAKRENGVSRRRLCALIGGATVAAMSPVAAVAAPAQGERRLKFHNLHTGETLSTVYWEKGCYDPAELRAVARICRDFRTGDIHTIDCHLLDLLHRLNAVLDNPPEIGIISGYRSPRTNASLRAKSSGVAKHSLHMQGKAIDIRIPHMDPRHVYKAALALKGGGAGLYTRSNFVHVDVGRVRHWGA